MPVTVVPTSLATVAIETFMTLLSSVIRNCAAASVRRTSCARPPAFSAGWAAAIGCEAVTARFCAAGRIPPSCRRGETHVDQGADGGCRWPRASPMIELMAGVNHSYYLLHTDGGNSGDPSGCAAIGALLRTRRLAAVAEISRAIGPATHNVAEYKAVIEGLKLA